MQLDSKNQKAPALLALSGTAEHRSGLGYRSQPFSTNCRHLVTNMKTMAIYKAEVERRLRQKSSIKTKPPAIGNYWSGQGGIYAGVIRNPASNKKWHLILETEQQKLAWGEYGEKIEGASCYWDGEANTKVLLTNNKCPAATWAASRNVDGHNDFYLPAQRELNLICTNLHDRCDKAWHWSSTQYSAFYAWYQDFEYGDQYLYDKASEFAVRAVRRLPI